MEYELHLIQESIRAARFAHRLLIIVSVVALIFAFSPIEDNVYKNAVKELNALLSLDMHELELRYVLRTHPTPNDYLYVKSIISSYDIDLSADTTIYPFIKIELHPPLINNSIHLNYLKMEDINTAVTSPHQLYVSIAKIDQYFEDDLRNFLQSNKTELRQCDKITRIIPSYSTDNIVNITFECYNVSTGGTKYTSAQLSHPLESDKFILPFNFLDEISKANEYNTLLLKRNADNLFLPYTKQVWDQVRSELPLEARNILARKDLPLEKRLEVFGASIPQKLISKIMPGLLFAMSIYFLVHIRYLIRQQKCNHIRNYPWVITMSGFLSTAVSVTTVLLLPVIALIGTIIATWTGHISALFVVTVVISVFTMMFLVVALVEVIAIKKNTVSAKG
ncbi:MAG TPA: hypothetical protein HPP81_06210 [Deltaproteobacteria bacterium]|jgi:hypothetical protein|nr:hypothetical protein [Deltaproteobacteria bacterium]